MYPAELTVALHYPVNPGFTALLLQEGSLRALTTAGIDTVNSVTFDDNVDCKI